MATRLAGGYSYILMKDVHGEKTSGMIKGMLPGGGPKPVQVLRGELLTLIPSKERVPRNDGGRPAHNYRSMKDSSVTLYEEDNLAPVNGKELMLLEAIEKPYDRFSVFSAGNKLEWGGSLGKGDQVYVKIPSLNTSVPTWSIACVHYTGPVEPLPGWNFGVEIKDPRYAGRGNSDGFFGGYKYFECEKDYGLFVSLDKLAPEPPCHPPQSTGPSVSQHSNTSPPSATNQSGKPTNSSVDCSFKAGDRVVVFNKKNVPIHGTVRWAGTDTQTRKLDSLHIGIETDKMALTKDFSKVLTGVTHLFSAQPACRLVVPVELVIREELANTRKPSARAIDLSDPVAVAREYGMTERQWVAEQKKALKEAEEIKRKEDKARKAEEKRNKDKNAKALEEVKSALKESIDLPAQKKLLEDFNKEKKEQVLRKTIHKEARANPDERENPAGQNTKFSIERSNSQQYPNENEAQQKQELKMNRPTGHQPHSFTASNNHSPSPAFSSRELPSQPPAEVYQAPCVPPQPPLVPFLGIGSRVQVPTTDQQAPKCYGVIRWIGTVPQILGQVAGIELEKYMEGCSDGTLKATGERFFHCKHGYGLYFPLASVQPVERLSGGSSQYLNEPFLPNRTQSSLDNEIATLRAQKATLERNLKRSQLELNGCKQELVSCKKELAARSIDVWTISRNKVQVEAKDIIGVGGWGSVSKGKVEVAVKQLHPIIMSPQNVAKIRREIELLAEVRHPNLVQFIGAVFEEKADVNQPPLIITELLDMNLRQAYEQNQLRPGDRLSIFMDIARALDYLHQRYEPIIHRDVSTANVLLQRMPDNKWKGKVSDLGSANFLQQAQTKGEGNILYSPPEVIPRAFNPRRERVPQTTKIDVYSYGVLLCEVTTSRFPSEENYWDMLQSVGRDHPRLHALIEHCTQEKPDDRPTMEAVLMQLNTKDMPQF